MEDNMADIELEYMKDTMEYLKILAIQANDAKNLCLARNSTAFSHVWSLANELAGKWKGFNSFIYNRAISISNTAFRLQTEYNATKSIVKFDNMVHEIEENYGAIFKTLLTAMKPTMGDPQQDVQTMKHASYLYRHT